MCTFVFLYFCNNITLTMAAVAAKISWWENWIKYIINIVMYFVGYLYIMDQVYLFCIPRIII
jgi:hypothetical protein